jgi:hypothetical protein
LENAFERFELYQRLDICFRQRQGIVSLGVEETRGLRRSRAY